MTPPPASRATWPAGGGRLLLVGMMGAGKSSVGTEIAAVTGWPYLDNDDLLYAATGSTARQLLVREGIDRLHQAEAEVLQVIGAAPAPLVAGVAASLVEASGSPARLSATGTVVYLRASAATLVARVAETGPRPETEHRPWVDTQGPEMVIGLLERRGRLYEQVADLIVDTDMTVPDQAARIILDWLLARGTGNPLT
ncbi:MAG: shikimate kinase [Actinomycetes bacterium]